LDEGGDDREERREIDVKREAEDGKRGEQYTARAVKFKMAERKWSGNN